MDPRPTLKSLGLPLESTPKSQEEARPTFMEAVSKLDSDELQHLASDTYRQAGTICWTTDEYQQSEHGKANAHVGLFRSTHTQKPTKSRAGGPTTSKHHWRGHSPASKWSISRAPLLARQPLVVSLSMAPV